MTAPSISLIPKMLLRLEDESFSRDTTAANLRKLARLLPAPSARPQSAGELGIALSKHVQSLFHPGDISQLQKIQSILRSIDVLTSPQVTTIQIPGKKIIFVSSPSISSDGEVLIPVVDSERLWHVFNPVTQNAVSISGSTGKTMCLSEFGPKGEIFALTFDQGFVSIFDLKKAEALPLPEKVYLKSSRRSVVYASNGDALIELQDKNDRTMIFNLCSRKVERSGHVIPGEKDNTEASAASLKLDQSNLTKTEAGYLLSSDLFAHPISLKLENILAIHGPVLGQAGQSIVLIETEDGSYFLDSNSEKLGKIPGTTVKIIRPEKLADSIHFLSNRSILAQVLIDGRPQLFEIPSMDLIKVDGTLPQETSAPVLGPHGQALVRLRMDSEQDNYQIYDCLAKEIVRIPGKDISDVCSPFFAGNGQGFIPIEIENNWIFMRIGTTD